MAFERDGLVVGVGLGGEVPEVDRAVGAAGCEAAFAACSDLLVYCASGDYVYVCVDVPWL